MTTPCHGVSVYYFKELARNAGKPYMICGHNRSNIPEPNGFFDERKRTLCEAWKTYETWRARLLLTA